MVSVLTASQDKDMLPIGSPDRSRSFLTIQIFWSDGRAVWIVVKRMQALANAGKMTYGMDKK